MNTKKTILTVGVVVLSLALLIAATYAWFTTEQTVLNEFSTKADANSDLGVEIVEDFDEEKGKDFQPGLDVKKDVKVVQTGTGSAIARVRFEEVLNMFEAAQHGTTGEWILKEYTSSTPVPSSTTGLPAGASYYPAKTTWEGFLNKANGAGLSEIADADIPAALKPAAAEGTLKIYGKVTQTQQAGKRVYTVSYLAALQIGTGNYAGAHAGEYQVVNITVGKLPGQDLNAPMQNATTYLQAAAQAGLVELSYRNFAKLPQQSAVHNSAGTIHLQDNTGADAHAIISMLFGNEVYPISEYATRGLGNWWYYDTDGWYYYAQKLEGGSTTPSVLKSVSMSGDAGNNWLGVHYDINVRLQGLQPLAEAISAEWNVSRTAAQLDTINGETGHNPGNLAQDPMTAAAKALMGAVVGGTITP